MGAGVPVAITLNVALSLAVTVCALGCVVMAGPATTEKAVRSKVMIALPEEVLQLPGSFTRVR